MQTSLNRKIEILCAVKLSLEDFIKSPVTNAYVNHNGLHSYVRKSHRMIDGQIKNTLDRANTTNKKTRNRYKNFETTSKPKSTGLYKEFDDHMHDMARKHGFDGVYVESVQNRFLPKKLLEYRYKQIEDPHDWGSAPNFYKSSK